MSVCNIENLGMGLKTRLVMTMSAIRHHSIDNICTKTALILSVCISVHAYESGRFIHQISFSNNITELIINIIAIYHHS